MCLITRKSNVNPGTRYYARGLNEKGGVGNEIECELLMFYKDDQKADTTKWCTFIWRRGTVPVWWRSELKSQVTTESDIVIRENPFESSDLYYLSLIRRFGNVPITLLNTLKIGLQQEETQLSDVSVS